MIRRQGKRRVLAADKTELSVNTSRVRGTIPSWQPSSRDGLSPSLLARLNDFIHIANRTYLEYRPILQGRMLRQELNGMIHVPRLKHENAAKLFLGFRIGTVGRRNFAVLPIHGQRGFRRLKSFSTSPVSVRAQMVVVLKTFVEHCVSF